MKRLLIITVTVLCIALTGCSNGTKSSKTHKRTHKEKTHETTKIVIDTEPVIKDSVKAQEYDYRPHIDYLKSQVN